MDLRANHHGTLSDDVTEAVLTAWLERNAHHCGTPDWLVNGPSFLRWLIGLMVGERSFLDCRQCLNGRQYRVGLPVYGVVISLIESPV